MDLYTYESLISSEKAARRYLVAKCWVNRIRHCPRCGSRKYYLLRVEKRRCKRCDYTYHDFTGRWINTGSLTCGQWLRIIKLFELELSTRKIAQQLRLAYNTAYKAVNTVRASILAHAEDAGQLLSGEIELDESYFGGRRKGRRGRGAAGKIPVFGILERDGVVSVQVVSDVRAETLLLLTVNKVRRGSVVYTDRFGSYDSLIFCGYRHLQVDHQTRFSRGRVYINGLEGFWSFAKERLMKHHGISPRRFPLYLKEMEFRYNHRNQDFYEILVKYLCDFVQNLE
jgi:transposase